jgi:hypothetical protein
MNFDSLVKDILENPELILQQDFSEDDLIEIQKRINPYSSFSAEGIDTPNFKKLLVCSYTNLREEYIKKFLMTSIIGFIYQMFNEYEIEQENREIPPNHIGEVEEIRSIIQTLLKNKCTIEPATADTVTTDTTDTADTTDTDPEVVNTEVVTTDTVTTDTVTTDPKVVNTEVVTTDTVNTDPEANLLSDNMASDTLGEIISEAATTDATAATTASLLNLCLQKLDALKEKLDAKITIPEPNAKTIVYNFLASLFKFDPNVHVRSASIDESKIEEEVKNILGNEVVFDAKDPSRLPLKTLLARNIKKDEAHLDTYRQIVESQHIYNAFCTILSDDGLISAMEQVIQNQLAFKAYLLPLPENSDVLSATENIPPGDTFHRWNYYTEVNFEEIRRVTAALYFEKPDLDLLFGAWNTIEGEPEIVDEEFVKYCQKNQSDFPSDIKSLEFGQWSFLGDFKQNREKIHFYNKNTEILKRILDRHEDDKKIGTELMRNRIRQKKAKNIAEAGPDAEGLAQYRSVHSISLPGGEKVISNEEMLRLEKAKGNIKAAKELEVLESLEHRISEIQQFEKTRPLTYTENLELEKLKERLEFAHQMAAVPDGAIQVDVFTNDTNTGDFKKSSFYTKSEELAQSHMIKKD